VKFERPKIGMQFNKLEKTLETFGAIIVIIYFLKLCVAWKALPKIMVLDYSFLGNADLFGSKYYLLMLGVILVVIFCVLTFFSFKPCCFYYFVIVTEKNARRVYKMTRIFLEILKIEVALGFVYNEIMLIESTKVGLKNMGSLGHIFVWGSVIVTIILYFLLLYKFQGKNSN